MIWFTSDLHFNHTNIIKYEPESRGQFHSLEEMNEKLISNWNERVDDNDTVYILGDVFMGSGDTIQDIMPRLKGKKILIRGNHDTNKRVELMKPYLEGVYDTFNLKYNGKFYVLCHYPMREWFNKEHHSVHLYGHVHSNEHRNGCLAQPNSYHIGVDTNGLRPISIEEIDTRFKNCHHANVKKEEGAGVHCLDCGKVLRKYHVNGKDVWI